MKKMKILAVDDNPTNIEIIQEILSERYELETATSGDEAIQLAISFEPDLILLDVMMPGLDGYQVCRKLRTIPKLKETNIIMVTAKGELEARLKGHEYGADDYLAKPFSEEDLTESVEFFGR